MRVLFLAELLEHLFSKLKNKVHELIFKVYNMYICPEIRLLFWLKIVCILYIFFYLPCDIRWDLVPLIYFNFCLESHLMNRLQFL